MALSFKLPHPTPAGLIGCAVQLCVALLFSTSLLANENQLTVVYEADIDARYEDQLLRLQAPDALPSIMQFVNETVPFAEPVLLRIGAEDGPLFDPDLNEIWIPAEFLLDIENRFAEADIVDTREERNDVMLDVFMHTLLHEVAHAIIAQFAIPSLGREEDAADNLANVLLLEYANEGDIVALNAADMFALDDDEINTYAEDDFWDEHSLDIQRYYTTLCHIYGSNPEDNEAFIETGELSADRAERCIDEYEQIRSDWLHVLDELQSQ